MLNQIRYQQQLQQFRSAIAPGVGTVVTYGSRDPMTGWRSIQTADGGIDRSQYLSNSEPGDVLPVAQFSTIGLTGYINQKPH
jgi:hypothetical protein